MGLLWEIHCERGAELQRAFEGQGVIQAQWGSGVAVDSKALVLRHPAAAGYSTIVEWPLSASKITNESPRVVLTAEEATWAQIKDKDSLRVAIQSDKIQIGGYYPLLFTHQSAVVEGILDALKVVQKKRR